MKILMTGTDGYIGSVMADVLLGFGHEVTGIDTGFYRAGWLYDGVTRIPATITRDVRDLTVDDLAGADAVVHLAELSNDPLGQLAPEVTFEINHRGSVGLARLAREAGVPRFVYMSSLQRLRHRQRCARHRGVAAQPPDRLRGMQGPGRA